MNALIKAATDAAKWIEARSLGGEADQIAKALRAALAPDSYKLTFGGVLCGGCQQHGASPYMKGNRCTICDRTSEKIMRDHGIVELSEAQRARIAELRRASKGTVPTLDCITEKSGEH